MSAATYTIMNIFMYMLTPIHTRAIWETVLIPTKVNMDPMSMSTLTMAESHMTIFNRAK